MWNCIKTGNIKAFSTVLFMFRGILLIVVKDVVLGMLILDGFLKNAIAIIWAY